jgi:hypothetical protein
LCRPRRFARFVEVKSVKATTRGTAAEIRVEVQRLFIGFGVEGGYIMSACDRFFETPPENLCRFARAAREPTY